VVNYERPANMKSTTKGSGKSMKMQTPAVRASISFPPALYETIEEIAKQKKVSLAWVVREAAEKYVTELKPTARKQ
jgi:predicted DNA-binding ribbon-helix-helix protein